MEAYGIRAETKMKPGQSVKGTLRGRLLLQRKVPSESDTPKVAQEKQEYLDELRESIGDENYQLVQQHDQILMQLIESMP